MVKSMNNEHLLWSGDMGDGSYTNPILFADYSDPDVIRVGDTYYMTASSFSYVPGLPILISKDLVNWELVNYAVGNLPYDMYDIPQHSKGVWAPAIRYHRGRFYIYFGMPDNGIFVVHTEDPLGQWSKPILVLEGKGYIDPCPFWDDDGRAYVVHGYARSRIGFKSFLGIFEMSPDGFTAISRDKLIYNGLDSQPTIEGPKVEKRNGYYYIFAPAGGVTQGWQTVLRSREIYGPYEERIAMKQGDSETNGPHQGALIDTLSGEEWFVHFQDKGLYGRIVHLQPVTWEEDWPIIGLKQKDEDTYGQPVSHYKKPDIGHTEQAEPIYLYASDDFDHSQEAIEARKLKLQWQWMGNVYSEFYDLLQKGIRLYALNRTGEHNPCLWTSPNVLTQKIICPSFEVRVQVDVKGLKDYQRGGLVLTGGQYAYIGFQRSKQVNEIIYVESRGTGNHREEMIIARQELKGIHENSLIDLQLVFDEVSLSGIFAYREPGMVSFKSLGPAYKPSDDTWVGSKIGVFGLDMVASGSESDCDEDRPARGYIDILDFNVIGKGRKGRNDHEHL